MRKLGGMSSSEVRALRAELNRACAKCGRLFAEHGALAPHTNQACDGFEERKPS